MALDAVAQREIVRLARAQNGVVSVGQLHQAGLTNGAIRARVARGRLVRLFRGIYATADPALLPLGRESAALLSIGSNAVLSHRSAAAVWGLAAPDPHQIHVTVPGSHPDARPGVRIHRVKQLHPHDVATKSGLRLTTPARTMIDFASDATSSERQAAFGEARAKGMLSDRALERALRRLPPNHSGAAIVRSMLYGDKGSTYTRSEAERIMRKLVRDAGLPQPLVNTRLLGYTADFVWSEQRLIVEVDGYSTHGNRAAFEADRKRDLVHVAAGYVVVRISWWQLVHEPIAVIARVAQALALRAA